MKDQLRVKKYQMKSENEKRIFSQILSGKVVKKYKLTKDFAKFVSPYKQRKYCENNILVLGRLNGGKRSLFTEKCRNCVREFLERDENSAMAPGIKDCIRRKKTYYRKRYLLDTMENLHKKYNKEEPMKISRGLFHQMKPFWIGQKKESQRDTCLCKTHENFDLVVRKLRTINLLNTGSKNEIVSQIVCDSSNEACMYRRCSVCKDKKIIVKGTSDTVAYQEWVTEKIVRPGAKGKMYEVQLTTKKTKIATSEELAKIFYFQLPIYMKHVYDTSHQFKFISRLRKNLKQNEVQIVVDFSENYKCKYASEIQSVHFGASQKQVSLHTGAYFYKTNEGIVECVSFCSFSENLRHDAGAVWAHMKPILEEIREKLPHIDVVHFQSDGPSTQYKNKSNFYLFRHFSEELKFHLGSWTFTTPGHGKSCADGSGGTIKSLCDRSVLQGNDVLSAEDMVEVIKKAESKIQTFLITTEDMQDVDKVLKKVIPIPQTKKTFQLIWTDKQKDRIFTNTLACFDCLNSSPCKHHTIHKEGFIFKEAVAKNAKKADKISQKRNPPPMMTQEPPNVSKISQRTQKKKIPEKLEKVPKQKKNNNKKLIEIPDKVPKSRKKQNANVRSSKKKTVPKVLKNAVPKVKKNKAPK